MAINFPSPVINGNTYDYNGIRYTYTKSGVDEGYWRVTTPGSVGIATSNEISAGTDGVKYVTPLGLVGTAEWDLLVDAATTAVAGTLAVRTASGNLAVAEATDPSHAVAYSQLTNYAKITDTKAPTVDGGTFNTGAWRTRTLNTKDNDDDLIASLATNQVTLQAGRYRVKASAPGYEVGGHVIRLRNITDGFTEIVGRSGYINYGLNAQSYSFLSGEFSIASAKSFEIQHYCSNSDFAGFGVSADGGGENAVYTTIEIWKV